MRKTEKRHRESARERERAKTQRHRLGEEEWKTGREGERQALKDKIMRL